MPLAYSVGQLLTADRMNSKQPITATKSGTTAITSNTTLASDVDLVLTLRAGFVYDLSGVVLANSAANAAGDMTFAFTWTNTLTFYFACYGLDSSLASGQSGTSYFPGVQADTSSPSATGSCGLSTATTSLHIQGRITVGPSLDSAFGMQFAQLASNANASNILAGSWLTAIPVQ